MKKIFLVCIVWITTLYQAHSALIGRPELNSALTGPKKTPVQEASSG